MTDMGKSDDEIQENTGLSLVIIKRAKDKIICMRKANRNKGKTLQRVDNGDDIINKPLSQVGKEKMDAVIAERKRIIREEGFWEPASERTKGIPLWHPPWAIIDNETCK